MTDENEGAAFRVNYALRPAKCIERKMIAEALHELNSIHDLKAYQYVGFGSAFFSDFILFHKALGIIDMISIEKDEVHHKRYTDNRPYKCIDLRFGHSNSILPLLTLVKPVIVWLDYECVLNRSVLEDLRYVCTKAVSGSVLIVTVNADPLGEAAHEKISSVTNVAGTDYRHVYDQYSEERGKWAVSATYRQILHDEACKTLRDRSGVLPREDKMDCFQIFNFEYMDSKRMLTYGALLYANRDADQVKRSRMSTSPAFRSGDSPYRIEVPILTLRELRILDAQLPSDCGNINRGSIPEREVKKYTQVYRYFPSFVEAEL